MRRAAPVRWRSSRQPLSSIRIGTSDWFSPLDSTSMETQKNTGREIVQLLALLSLLPLFIVTALFQGGPDMNMKQWMKHNGLTDLR